MAGRGTPRRSARRPAGAPHGRDNQSRPNWNPPEEKPTRGSRRAPTAKDQPHRDDPSERDARGRGRGRGGERPTTGRGRGPRRDHNNSAAVDKPATKNTRRAPDNTARGVAAKRSKTTGASVTDAAVTVDTTGLTFKDLGLVDGIVNELSSQSITEPFPIQAAAIPDALAGRDVLGRGPTGSGKTFTFGLPMLQRLAGAPSRPGRPRALVLEPTRELATQVEQRLADPAAALGLRVLSVVGGVNINHNIRSLAAPVDVLVATPGRAQDLINQKILDLSDVVITAIDEADQMADMGFLPQVVRLLNTIPRGGQTLLFSATLDGDVNQLVERYMHDPVVHSTAPVCGGVDTMTHYRLLVGSREDRTVITQHIGAREGSTIMFVRTRHGVDAQVRKLRRVGVNAVGLHGDKGQNTRQRALAGFADGSIPVLVATDIAARGIDINGVSLVVHVDPPAEHKAYMHRAGRTARGGSSGTVVTLVTDGQEQEVRALFSKTGIDAKEVRVRPGDAALKQITGAREPSGVRLAAPGANPSGNAGSSHGGNAGGRRGRRSPRRR